MAITDTLIDTLFDGRYRIVRKLGTGGMANVYLAEDQELGRSVAIKILDDRHAADEQFVERFRREAKNAASLSHPNIVAVYDRGEAEGTYYIAMEYLDGRTLKELLVRFGTPPVKIAIGYTRQVLSALAFAHKYGLVHRDIKPHNVLVDSGGHVKVTDFGIARSEASQMTEAGSIIGTAQYLSPEQARGAPVDQRSDIYSVGVLLYELLTGAVPFTGDTPVEIAMKHLSAVPEPPSKKRPDVPRGLDLAVVRALAKDPDDRFQSAEEMDAELARIEQGFRVSDETADAATAVLAGAGIDSTAVRKAPVVTTGAYRPPPRPLPAPGAETAEMAVAGRAAGTRGDRGAASGSWCGPPIGPRADVRPRARSSRASCSRSRSRSSTRSGLGHKIVSADEHGRPQGQGDPAEPRAGRADTEGEQGDARRLRRAAAGDRAQCGRDVPVGGGGLTQRPRAYKPTRTRSRATRPRGRWSPRARLPTSWSTPRPWSGSTSRPARNRSACPTWSARRTPTRSRRSRASASPCAASNVQSNEPAETVLDQAPSANSAAPKGSTVTLKVSEGPTTTAVPGRHRPRPGHGDRDASLRRFPGGRAAAGHDRPGAGRRRPDAVAARGQAGDDRLDRDDRRRGADHADHRDDHRRRRRPPTDTTTTVTP